MKKELFRRGEHYLCWVPVIVAVTVAIAMALYFFISKG